MFVLKCLFVMFVTAVCFLFLRLFCRLRFKNMPISPGGGGLPYKRLLGMCRWMGSHFHDWTDYNGVAFFVELLEGIAHFRDFWYKKILVSRDLNIRRFAVKNGSCCCFKI